MSSKLSESAKEAAKDIGSSVAKLEKLFDRLYADTFSMMKDTVSDMRKHAWGETASETPNILEEAEKKAEEKTEALRKTFENQVAQVLEGQKITEGRIGIIRNELKQLIDRAIVDSRNVEQEAREETLRGHIIKRIIHVRNTKRRVFADDIVGYLHKQFPGGAVVKELKSMKEEGLVSWDEDEDGLGPDTEIHLKLD